MTIEQIKEKTQYGDYTTLARMLGTVNSYTAKMRFFRGNEEARKAMEKIVTTREMLIKEQQEENENSH